MNKSNVELEFWRSLYNEGNILTVRERDYNDNFKNFERWDKQKGIGLEVGSGLVSMCEFSGKTIVSIDPLMDEYNKIYRHPETSIESFAMSGEDMSFKDNTFDFVVCINVIDHTPNPDKMLSEIYRVLRKKGALYFEVHFDKALYDAHYTLWDINVVKKYLKQFRLKNYKIISNPYQDKYYAEYTK